MSIFLRLSLCPFLVASLVTSLVSAQEVVISDPVYFDLIAATVGDFQRLQNAEVPELPLREDEMSKVLDRYFTGVKGHEIEALFNLMDFQELEQRREKRDPQRLQLLDYLIDALLRDIPIQTLVETTIAQYDRDPPISAKELDKLIGRSIARGDLSQAETIFANALVAFDSPPTKYLEHIFEVMPGHALSIAIRAYFKLENDKPTEDLVAKAQSLGDRIEHFDNKDRAGREAIVTDWLEERESLIESELWPVRAFAATMMLICPKIRHAESIAQLASDPDPIVSALASQIQSSEASEVVD